MVIFFFGFSRFRDPSNKIEGLGQAKMAQSYGLITVLLVIVGLATQTLCILLFLRQGQVHDFDDGNELMTGYSSGSELGIRKS